jgi:6-pyruvoyl-tetrahydropterin synthase
MAEKVAKKIDSNTIIKCKDFEYEGDLNNNLWIVNVGDKIKIAIDVDEYLSMMENMKKVLKDNFELRLEKAILSEFPIDYDDVKAVVLEELKNSDKSIEEVVSKVKMEHPNLFYNIEFDRIL